MSRKILLADDSVTIQKVIELTFMDEDFEVKAVSNGDEALAALPDLRPDFVIADVHMPGANGYEVCRRAKELRSDVPVLLLVGTFEPFDEGQARAAGADSFLKKPFDSQELLQRVQDLLSSRAARPAAMPPPLPSPPPFDMHEPPPTLELDATPFRPAAEPDWGAFQLDPEPQRAAAPAFSMPEPFPSAEPFPAAEPFPSAEPFPTSFPTEPPPLRPAAPSAATPFLEEESPFVLEDEPAHYPVEESPSFQASDLPAGEMLFDFDNPAPEPAHAEPEPALSALPDVDFNELPPPPPHSPAGFGAPWSREEPAFDQHFGAPPSAAPEPAAKPWSLPEEPAPWTPPAPPEPPAFERPPLPPTTPLYPPPFSPPPAAAAGPSGAFAAPSIPPLSPPLPPPQPLAATPAAPASAAPPLQVGSVSANGGLSDADVDRIARRVVELMGDKAVRDVAWEVVPDLAEVVIRGRLRELESQVESSGE